MKGSGAFCIALLLAVAQLHSSVAETQATQGAQSTKSVQSTNGAQNAQNSQLFGLPPLPIALAAVGSFLASHDSPIRINTRIVDDKPAAETKSDSPASAAATADAPAAAEAPADQQQQQMVYGDVQPGKGASVSIEGTQQYVQYVAANQAPAGGMVWMPVATDNTQMVQQAPSEGTTSITTLSGPPQVISSDGATMALQVTPSGPQYVPGAVVSSTIVPGPTMLPQGQQSFIAVRNFTLNGTQDGNGTEFIQGTTVVSVPLSQPQQQQVQQQLQQVWVPVQQAPQVVQAYFNPGPQVIPGPKVTKVVSTTVTPIAAPGGQPAMGMVVKGGAGFGWGKVANKPMQGRMWGQQQGGQGFIQQGGFVQKQVGFGGQGFGVKAAGGFGGAVVMQPAGRPAMGASASWNADGSSGSSGSSDGSSGSDSQAAPTGKPSIVIVKQSDNAGAADDASTQP